MTALTIGVACGESTSFAKSSPALSPTTDPVQVYKAVGARVDAKVHKGDAFLLHCQPIVPSTPRRCRETVVGLVADETEAIAFLDAAAVPEKFKTLHAALRAGLVKAAALNSQAVSAIDSRNGTQAAPDAALAHMLTNVFPLLDQIESA